MAESEGVESSELIKLAGANKKVKPALDSKEFEPLLDVQEHPDEANDMTKAIFKGREVPGVSEAVAPGESPQQRIIDARTAVEASIRPKLEDKLRAAAVQAVIADTDGDTVKDAKKDLIDKIPIEKIYGILLEHGLDKLVEITDREARKVEPYKSMGSDRYIDAGQVLRSDLKNKFEGVQKVYDEVEKEVLGKVTGELKKRHDATSSFIKARDEANKLRSGDKAGRVDLMALYGNAEGTDEATKELADFVGKSDKIVAKRTFRDPKTKAYLREVAYAVDVRDPRTGTSTRSNKEVMVEVWNVGRNGGNLLRSSLVKVDTVKGKEWQWKAGQGKWGILPNRQEVDKPIGIMDQRFFRNRLHRGLSKGVRQGLDGVSKNMIDNSSRESSEGGDMGGYAMTSKLGMHNANLLGYNDSLAKKVAKRPGIIAMLSARLFNDSKKMSAKTNTKKR